jgi:anti-anti-sigma factor
LLNITIENMRGEVTVRCYGRLVYGRESALFCAAVSRHGRDIIVDLSGVTAIDAAGIGALVSLQATRTRLRLVDPSVTVRQVLRLTNLDSVFDICPNQNAERKQWFERYGTDRNSCYCQNLREK